MRKKQDTTTKDTGSTSVENKSDCVTPRPSGSESSSSSSTQNEKGKPKWFKL